MEAHEINAVVKTLNDATERPGDTAELEALQAKSTAIHALDFEAQSAFQQEIMTYRAKTIDVERRREIVAQLNAEPAYNAYRFRLINNRIMVEAR